MYENGKHPIPYDVAIKLADVLEIEASLLYDDFSRFLSVPYKRYDADVFTGVNRRTAAVFQFHSAALRRLNKVGCQRYEGDYTRLKQKHAERRARRMAG